MRREAEFQTLFRHWIMVNPMHTSAFELKQTTTDSIPFSEISEHQILALQTAKKKTLLYKIPDDSRGIKPFDMVYFHKTAAYVVIRYPKFFCLIDVDKFVQEDNRSQRRSLVSFRARAIAYTVVEL